MNNSSDYFCIRKKRLKAIIALVILLAVFVSVIYFVISVIISLFSDDDVVVSTPKEEIVATPTSPIEKVVESEPKQVINKLDEPSGLIYERATKAVPSYAQPETVYDRINSNNVDSNRDDNRVVLDNNSIIDLSVMGDIETFTFNKDLLNQFIHKVYYELNSSYREVVTKRLRADNDGDLMIYIELNGLKFTIYYKLKDFYFDKDPNYLKSRLMDKDLSYDELEKIKIYYSEINNDLIEIALIKNGKLESVLEKGDDINLISEEKFVFIYTQIDNIVKFKPTKSKG